MKKMEVPQSNEPLVEEKEQDKLINKYFTEEEAEDLIKEGFSKDQIAYVAKENIKGDKQANIIGKIFYIIFDIITWIFA